ncbi:MAG: peptidase U34 [archaeon]|nr:peptidase U34 [archaeon]
MCDTFVVLGNYTKNGETLFGKNSDRDPDEVQNIVFLPGGKHLSDENVKCTYLSIPQVEETYDVILSQPFWMFGGEIGVNQFGLAIGNEAVYSTEPLHKVGLLGMDMIRLALQRKKTAKNALEYIIYLLDEYGQGGGCGYHHRGQKYHNSWILADPNEAYVLETAGIHWVWKQIEVNYSISNILTIEDKFDGISDGAIANAIRNGRCTSQDDFSFKQCYLPRKLNMQKATNWGAHGDDRRNFHYSKTCILADSKSASVEKFIEILRAHPSLKGNNNYNPAEGSLEDICLHAATGLLRPSQSTNSMVAELNKDLTSIWTTAGSSPCVQIYKPLFLFSDQENEFPSSIQSGSEIFDENAVWWRNEILNRLIMRDYHTRISLYFKERDEIENKWILEIEKLKKEEKEDINRYRERVFKVSSNRFRIADKLMAKWVDLVKNNPIEQKTKKGFIKYWEKMNKTNKIPI